MIKVAVTGANGFIGRRVCKTLADRNIAAVLVSRQSLSPDRSGASGSQAPSPGLVERLNGCSAVIHLAGLAHSKKYRLDDLLEANLNATVRLAQGCVQASVPRLVFVSSLSVHGILSDTRIGAQTPIRPATDYGKSKAMAEEALERLCATRGLSTLALRAPLVCGRGAPGNLAVLRKAIRFGYPIPSADWNKRDLIGVQNLSELLVRATSVADTGFKALPVCDGSPVSTSTILRCMGEGANRTAWAIPVSRDVLAVLSSLPVLGSLLLKMCSNLEVDGSRAAELLAFSPQYSTELELVEAGRMEPEFNL